VKDITLAYKVAEKYESELYPISEMRKEGSLAFTAGAMHMPIVLKATLSKGGVCFSGYRLPIHIELINGSHSTIQHLKVIFQQKVFFHAGDKSLTRKSEFFGGDVPGSTVQPRKIFVQQLEVDVPKELEPSINIGTLIQRKYDVIVELYLNWRYLRLSFPISIFVPSEADAEVISTFTPNDQPAPLFVPPQRFSDSDKKSEFREEINNVQVQQHPQQLQQHPQQLQHPQQQLQHPQQQLQQQRPQLQQQQKQEQPLVEV